MRSLVYHAGALGDFVTTLPALTGWRQLHPSDQMVLWGRLPQGKLALAASLADEIREVEGAEFTRYFSGNPEEEDLVSLRGFGSALLFTRPDSPLAQTFKQAGLHKLRLQAPFPEQAVPIVDYHLSLFEPVPPPGRDVDPFRDFRVRLLGAAGGPLSPPAEILIHPGSGSPSKNWPMGNFLDLATRLEQTGFRVAWLAGPAEENWTFPASHPLLRCPDLVELARILAGARLFIGNDAGTTHLAAAMGCPTMAIFLASDAATWAPRGIKVKVLDFTGNGDGFHSAGIPQVLDPCLTWLRESDDSSQHH